MFEPGQLVECIDADAPDSESRQSFGGLSKGVVYTIREAGPFSALVPDYLTDDTPGVRLVEIKRQPIWAHDDRGVTGWWLDMPFQARRFRPLDDCIAIFRKALRAVPVDGELAE